MVNPVCFAAEPPPDTGVAKLQGFHRLYWIDVAQVHHHRIRHRGLHPGEIEGAKFVPFGDDDGGVRSLQKGIRAVGELSLRQQQPG